MFSLNVLKLGLPVFYKNNFILNYLKMCTKQTLTNKQRYLHCLVLFNDILDNKLTWEIILLFQT